MRFIVAAVLLTGLIPACAGAQAPTPKEQHRVGLVRESLAGQIVPVLPLTHLVRDTAVKDSVLLVPRAALLAWADSILTEGLVERAPEISWLYGADLDRVARKGAGMIPEPARFGHSILRSGNLKTVPDPTRAYLRTLSGLANARFVFVPASLLFARDSSGVVQATLVAAVTDTRTGAIGWRASAIGTGPTAAAALKSTIDFFLPDQTTPP